MAVISNLKFTAKKESNGWTFYITYDAEFSQFEVDNFQFEDYCEIWEDDVSYDDKILSNYGGTFNPTALKVPRKYTFETIESQIDTEIGNEEFYAIIRLRNIDLNQSFTKRSNTASVPV